jgi:hypothetical protein
VSQGLIQAINQAFTSLPPVGQGFVIAAGCWLVLRIILAVLNLFHRHYARQKIYKAADNLEKSVSNAAKELKNYSGALKTFMDRYNDKAALTPVFEAFKLEITRFALPKPDPTKFKNIVDFCYVHRNKELYYRSFYNGVMLAKSCNLYREFFAQDNWHHLAAIGSLISSLYHDSAIKPHAEYVARKVPEEDADYAMRYFAAYDRLNDEALGHADSLQKDLNWIKLQNTYWPILAWRPKWWDGGKSS